MLSTALEVVTAGARYLVPAAFLALCWVSNGLLFKILNHISSVIKSFVYPEEQQKQDILDWLKVTSPVRVASLETVWRRGWILCAVLGRWVRGACDGHPPNKMSLKHAQMIAQKHLGVAPVFTDDELEDYNSLDKNLESKLITYLVRIKGALQNFSEPITTLCENDFPTLDYKAQGAGLEFAHVTNKSSFKIYPTNQQCLEPGEITITIQGPNSAFGKIVIPPVLGEPQKLRQKAITGFENKKQCNDSALSSNVISPLRVLKRKDKVNNICHVPKNTDIYIKANHFDNHVEINYFIKEEGKYTISIKSKNQHITKSPFHVNGLNNFSIKDTTNEKSLQFKVNDEKKEVKVILRIVDLVNEKMLLTDKGFKKITDEEALILMTPDDTHKSLLNSNMMNCESNETAIKLKGFNEFIRKILIMQKVCRNLKNLSINKSSNKNSSVPDIVNSTFKNEIENDNCTLVGRNDQNCNISLINQDCEEISLRHCDSITYENIQEHLKKEIKEVANVSDIQYRTNCLSQTDKLESTNECDEVRSSDQALDIANNLDIRMIERPKTPILKFLTGELTQLKDSTVNSIVIDHNISKEVSSEKDKIKNKQVTDFIIGAPVSKLPLIKAPSPDPDVKLLSCNESQNRKVIEDLLSPEKHNFYNNGESSTQYDFTKICDSYDNLENTTEENPNNKNLNLEINKDDENVAIKENSLNHYQTALSKYDSAYVSIDENSMINFSNTHFDKAVLPNNIGPAEKEIWENCSELKTNTATLEDCPKSDAISKNYIANSNFTPINEEIENNEYSEKSWLNKNFENHKHSYVSMSEDITDVKTYDFKSTDSTSKVQLSTELFSESHKINSSSMSEKILRHIRIKFGDSRASLVMEKKKYWDDKIRQFEIEEKKFQQIKKKTQQKLSRHTDSLTKKKGRSIVKNFIASNDYTTVNLPIDLNDNLPNNNNEHSITLVTDWKKYWDERLAGEKETQFLSRNEQNVCPGKELKKFNDENDNVTNQDIPEELFKAFETSPKRFFGTSRKKILNKIDAFTDKLDNKRISADLKHNDFLNENGIVPNRVALYQNITDSNLDHVCLKNRESRSMSIERKKIKLNKGVIDKLNKGLSQSEINLFEMDSREKIDYQDQHKSYEELPNINVKKFINLYESVSKPIVFNTQPKQLRETTKVTSGVTENSKKIPCFEKETKNIFILEDMKQTKDMEHDLIQIQDENGCKPVSAINEQEKLFSSVEEIKDNMYTEPLNTDSPTKKRKNRNLDYKTRFKKSKQYFQSLEELTGDTFNITHKMDPFEEIKIEEQNYPLLKMDSAPCSLVSDLNELNKNYNKTLTNKIMTICDRFQVHNVYRDVVNDKLSYYGSMRGIPNKKAVLEAFKSMENLSDKQNSNILDPKVLEKNMS